MSTARMLPAMEPLVFHQPAAEIAFGTLVLVWVLSERLQDLLQLRRRGHPGAQDAGSYFVVLAGTLSGLAAGLVLATHGVARLPFPGAWVVAGVAIGWAGLLLRLWAERTLGRFFTLRVRVVPDQPVVTSGPYRLVRHPSYLGALVMLLGIGRALGSLASALTVVVLPAAALVRRIAVEEAALRRTLGEPYVDYCRRRTRLIPGVW